LAVKKTKKKLHKGGKNAGPTGADAQGNEKGRQIALPLGIPGHSLSKENFNAWETIVEGIGLGFSIGPVMKFCCPPGRTWTIPGTKGGGGEWEVG